jgi:hypothetical protein
MPASTLSVPVETSTIRAYVLSDLRYAMMGSVHNIVLRMLKASNALPDIGPLVYSASFLLLYLVAQRFVQNF